MPKILFQSTAGEKFESL